MTLEKLNKKAPFQLPPKVRKPLADYLWALALVGGVLQLLGAYGLWEAGHRYDKLVDYANTISSYYGGPSVAPDHIGLFYYLSLISMAVVGVMLLLAAPNLKNMKKDGWNMLFYVTIVEVVASVFLLLTSYYGGFGDFIGGLIGAAVGAYLLFQVRDHFLGHKVAGAKAAEHHAHEDKKE